MSLVVIAIDPGKTSGWCVMRDGGIVSSGVATKCAHRSNAVRMALEMGDARKVIAVVEQWTVGGRAHWNPSTMIGLGSARGRWLEQLDLVGVCESHVVSVTPAKWRSLLAGLPRRTSDEAKASARIVARARVGREVALDEGEAVCMGVWAMAAPELAGLRLRCAA